MTGERWQGWLHRGALLLLPLAAGPLLWQYGTELWDDPRYQFFPLLLAGAAALAIGRVRDLESIAPGWPRWTILALAPSLACFVLAAAIGSPWHAAIATLLWVPAAVYHAGGRRLLSCLLPIWVMLWLLVQWPFDLDTMLVLALQRVTVGISSGLLDLLGQTHLVTGNVIVVADRRLLVEEACSGVQSLFAGLALAWWWSLAQERPWWRTLLLVASVPLWVVLANALRVAAVTWLWNTWQIDTLAGWRHDVVGLAVFLIVAALLFSTDAWLELARLPRRLGPQLALDTRSIVNAPATAAVRHWPVWQAARPGAGVRWLAGSALLAAALLLGLQWARPTTLAGRGLPAGLPELNAATLPPEVGPWQLEKFERMDRRVSLGIGTESHVWQYRGPGGRCLVSLDYPFRGWHEVSVCYQGEGWTQLERHVASLPLPLGETTVLTTVRLHQSLPELHGYLLFDLFDRRGQPLYRQGDPLSIAARLQRRIARSFEPFVPETPACQLQVLVESPDRLNPEAEAAARLLFETARQRLVRLCTWEGADG